MNGGEGIILSKRGDITIGWEAVLPPAFRCNEATYDSIISGLYSAIGLLPDWAIVHKQDIFMFSRYKREAASSFLEDAYERHFDNRKYLDHICRIWLTFSTKSNIRGGTSGIMGMASHSGLPDNNMIMHALDSARQFASIVQGSELISLRQLTEDDIFGTKGRPGIIQNYLNFTEGGNDILSNMEIKPDYMRTGDKYITCSLVAEPDQLPSEISSCKEIATLSTDGSSVVLSTLSEIGIDLNCEHIINQFILKESVQELIGRLDSKRRRMQSMSTRSAENRIYAEEINEFLEDLAASSKQIIKTHYSIFAAGDESDYKAVNDKIMSAVSKIGITPIQNIYDTPCQFWAAIPGNAAGLSYSEYMTMELRSALCLSLYDGFDTGIKDGAMKMCDRLRLVPQRFDIQEKAFEKGLIDNYNVFLLGPSGSGKSFCMNKYLWSCYITGQHCFLIDVGDSYRTLCHIIHEESGGKNGSYYTFEKGNPISFNPFRNIRRFMENDNRAWDFLFTLMCTLWKNGSEPVKAVEHRFIKTSVTMFISQWKKACDPVFNDYYDFLQDSYSQILEKEGIEKEYFDIRNYLISLEQFYKGGIYGYLLNSEKSIDILNDRFVVFEIDSIKDDKVIYPITTLVIMDAFMEKMTANNDFKTMCIEEAWKALMGTQMSEYMLELYKTARKHRTSAVVVSQELKDIMSSPIVKDTIIENSAVKILLDQSKYANKFDVLAENLSLNDNDKSLVLSLNKFRTQQAQGREIFFNLGNRKSFVMRLEVSPEEAIAFSSHKQDKVRLAKEVAKTGSYIKAIKNIVSKQNEKKS